MTLFETCTDSYDAIFRLSDYCWHINLLNDDNFLTPTAPDRMSSYDGHDTSFTAQKTTATANGDDDTDADD